MLSDIEIAQQATIRPIAQIADALGVPPDAVVPYGRTKAKLALPWLGTDEVEQRTPGHLVLVTAVSPTPAGEGKTTTSVGLADGLARLGQRSLVALREPSMGPVFGMKGGAAGGGYAQVIPMEDINLHFTGDFAAIAAANNLLSALLDNHIHHGNTLDIDARTVSWKRVVDLNDRALRDIVVGLGGTPNGFPRQDGFDIVVASEVMAILCLATSMSDLKQRLSRIVVAHNRDKKPVTAADLEADGAMAVLLKDALSPNLVQTLEGTPAMIHGGPFANIAHGCNSVMATRTALRLADVVVTEAGFGADLGAEKFLDIKCRTAGLQPSAAVVVATVRALKFHGGVARTDLGIEDADAVRRGGDNLRRHLQNLREVWGVPAVVAINRFPGDTDAEVEAIIELAREAGVPAHSATHFSDGGAGAEDLAREVLGLLGDPITLRHPYELSDPLVRKAEKLARTVYSAAGVTWDAKARRKLQQITDEGYGELPVCVAKTQYSFSTDPTALGAPSGHIVHVREVRLAAGAGFVVLVTGEVMTMPGLPKVPASGHIDISDDGTVSGLS